MLVVMCKPGIVLKFGMLRTRMETPINLTRSSYHSDYEFREDDEHESYFGHRDVDSLVQTMEYLVESLSTGSHPLALEGNVTETKRPAPKTGGCIVAGFVRVKKVPGNLIVSARTAAHSFDASQMNMSHVVNKFLFGRNLTPQERGDVHRMIQWVRRPVDTRKMNGLSYIANPSESNANVTVGVIEAVKKTLADSEKVTALWVTHRLEELEYADGAIYMKDGKIIMQSDASNMQDFIEFSKGSYLDQRNS